MGGYYQKVTTNIAMPTLTNEIISAAIFGFEEQRRRLDAQIAELRAMLSDTSNGATPGADPRGRKKRGMSAAGRKAIAEAQRKRWAASKGTNETPKAATKPKRKLSSAGRAAIVAAVKKRWAAKKAA
jgi:hypothetical protein